MTFEPSLDLIIGPMYSGKCFAPDTTILMYNGEIELVQNLKKGDLLMGDDSTPRLILNTCHGISQMYKIIPYYGNPFIVNEDHILSLKCSFNHDKKYVKDKVVNISVKDYLNESKTFRLYFKGYRNSVNFSEKSIELDPYILGTWLGDGTSCEPSITTIDDEILNYYKSYFEPMNLKVKFTSIKKKIPTYRVSTEICGGNNWFINQLRKLQLLNNKHIPLLYKANSREIRLKLLAGLLDTDGYFDPRKKSYEITQKRKNLAEDILYVARSLGFVSYINETEKYCTYKGEKRYGIYYKVSISGTNLHDIPCLLDRKKMKEKYTRYNKELFGFRIEKLGKGEYYGFSVDSNHLFLLGDFTVTHNSSELLSRLNRFNELGFKALYINHSADCRDEKFSTHNTTLKNSKDQKLKMLSISSLQSINTSDIEDISVIGIDESQFFSDLSIVKNWVEKLNKKVIISGLDGDYNRQKFGSILDLIPLSDTIIKLDALCELCAKSKILNKALFTHYLLDKKDSNNIDIGAKDKYIALCRKHYIELNSF